MKEVSEGGKYNGNWKSNREGNGRRNGGERQRKLNGKGDGARKVGEIEG